MNALDALLMPIPENDDEMDVANRLIDLRESAAAELARLQRIEKAAKSLMDTFDEFGNFNYSSEHIDALSAALESSDAIR